MNKFYEIRKLEKEVTAPLTKTNKNESKKSARGNLPTNQETFESYTRYCILSVLMLRKKDEIIAHFHENRRQGNLSTSFRPKAYDF